ncbi:MAG TPA: superoxide dismutase, partial [Verrucomicrobiales bacterium]|nr:superoxide dismutase [Verrucomicrobiales bacterium]
GRLFADEEQGKKMFVDRAMGVFGSGWVWISVGKDKELVLETTPNQDTPLALGHKPLYGLDLWEHAYYLKYQNRRIDYIQAAMQVVNWPFLEDRYAKLTA